MFSWDLAITLTIVAATVIYSTRGIYRALNSARSGCGSSCGSCPFKDGKVPEFKVD